MSAVLIQAKSPGVASGPVLSSLGDVWGGGAGKDESSKDRFDVNGQFRDGAILGLVTKGSWSFGNREL
jgi:hypothetical protein